MVHNKLFHNLIVILIMLNNLMLVLQFIPIKIVEFNEQHVMECLKS